MLQPAAAHRCQWSNSDPLLRDYHDTEWGLPQRDPRMLWEMLMLEGFQAGLAWITVLRKRPAFRAAFAGFDPMHVAAFTDGDVERLLGDPGIIRSRAKIDATILGARIYCDMGAPAFAALCWSFTGGKVLNNDGLVRTAVSPLSQTVSTELKRRGFKFVGPTIAHAWLQAVGIVNDHEIGCFRRG